MTVLVNTEAPNFTAQAVMPNGTIEPLSLEQFRGEYVVLFFWPLDFTFVCPTEIIAHNKRVEAFKERNVQLIGCSIDSQFTHAAWRNTAIDKGGIGEVGFPMVADVDVNPEFHRSSSFCTNGVSIRPFRARADTECAKSACAATIADSEAADAETTCACFAATTESRLHFLAF